MVAHFGEQVVDERLVRLVLELELVLVLVLVRLVRIAMDCPACSTQSVRSRTEARRHCEQDTFCFT